MESKFSKQVKKHFGFLLDEYGFVIDNYVISEHGEFETFLLRSNEIVISIQKEYSSDVFVYFADPERVKNEPGNFHKWKEITMLLDFLRGVNEEKKHPFYYKFLSGDKIIDKELSEISRDLKNNYDKILAIFKSKELMEEFEVFSKEFVEKMFKKYGINPVKKE